ncbi:hypothetical protein J1614_002686 [Plenodomus biglobosus]|nr:hypothetical protein J1614_002686 [Plenodomus biglobosus]
MDHPRQDRTLVAPLRKRGTRKQQLSYNISAHVKYVYSFNDKEMELTPSYYQTITKHGWIASMDILKEACKTAQQQRQNGDFEAWMHDVLHILETQYPHSWTPNNGNTL